MKRIYRAWKNEDRIVRSLYYRADQPADEHTLFFFSGKIAGEQMA